MRHLVILQFLFLTTGCGPEFVEPETGREEIGIEVDSTCNEHSVTMTI